MTLEEFDKQEVEKAKKIAGEIARNMGITAAEAEEAIGRTMRHLQPSREIEIEQIKQKPPLSRLQKRRMIREIRKGANNEH